MLALFIIALVIHLASFIITVSGKLFAAQSPGVKVFTVVLSLVLISVLILGIVHF